jgi:hypothetical protein
MADDESDKLRPYLWPELLTRPRREQLVDEILFSKGVTTPVAQSGDGKTTFANSVGLTVATGGKWDGKIIKPRPLVWCAGEGQDDMRPMYEAWMQFHADAPTPFGFWLDEAIDFSSETATKQFNELLKDMKMAEAVIVPDALADHIAGLDENSSKDINQVYKNIWEVVKVNGATFLIPHHAGWDEKRERGSTAIRAKSDIVLQIVKFEAEKGTVELKHHKRRGGRKLPQLLFELKLIEVEGYAQAIPIVTGMKPGAVATRELGDYAIMILCLELLGGRAIRARWFDQVGDFTAQRDKDGKGWSPDTFDRRRKEMQDRGWIVGGGGQNVPYEFANTEEAKRARAEASGCTWTPSEKGDEGADDPSTNHPHAGPLQGPAASAGGFEGPASTRKAPANGFAAGSSKGGNDSDSVASPPINDDESGLVDEAIQHLKKGGK